MLYYIDLFALFITTNTRPKITMKKDIFLLLLLLTYQPAFFFFFFTFSSLSLGFWDYVFKQDLYQHPEPLPKKACRLVIF